ncbi:MAG: hypothetical protein GVY15_13310 [Bacteroidetes bacterium]|jgi:hypothetical protein|nr:hypothetical protein [Bacteroidota bacterium]
MLPSDVALVVLIVGLLIPLVGFAFLMVRHTRKPHEPNDWLPALLGDKSRPIVSTRATLKRHSSLDEVRALAAKSYLRIQRDSLFGEAPEPGRVLIERMPKAVWQHVSAQEARTELTLCLQNQDGEQYVVAHRMWLN